MELDTSDVIATIMDLAKQLDALNAFRGDYFLPLPDWMPEVAKQCIRDNIALEKFKRNSSYWPEKLPWRREYPCVFEE